MTTDDLINYYAELLIVQYATKFNAIGMVESFVSEVVADQIIAQVRDAFQITTTPGVQPGDAVGVQIDALATYRGCQRLNFGINLDRQYWQMPLYGAGDADTANGFSVYGSSVTWFFLTYGDANAPIYSLTDAELIRLIQFRAQVQSSDYSLEAIDDILFAFFGDNVSLFESGLMQITYVGLIDDPDTLFSIVNLTGSLPDPAGVQVQVIKSNTPTSFFGFQLYNTAINPTFVGFGLYGSSQAGSFVRYP
jgi:hypothetical protein